MNNIKRCKMKILPLPSKSPDLSITKNLWIDFKRAVHARRPKNLTEIQTFCNEERLNIPQTNTERLICYKSVYKL